MVYNHTGPDTYFFHGYDYIRYDITADRADSGYPQPIASNWPGLLSFDVLLDYGLYLARGLQDKRRPSGLIFYPYNRELKKQGEVAEKRIHELGKQIEKNREKNREIIDSIQNASDKRRREEEARKLEEEKAREVGKLIQKMIKIWFEHESRKAAIEEEQRDGADSAQQQRNENERNDVLRDRILEIDESHSEAEDFERWEEFNRTA